MSWKSLMFGWEMDSKRRQKAWLVSTMAVLVVIFIPFLWLALGSEDFCDSDSAMDMHMYGFKTVFSDDVSCILLFFSSWELDTKVRFAFACIGVCILGAVTESMSWLRREVRNLSSKSSSGSLSVWDDYVMSVLYVVQLTLGYLLMLVVMTFQVELIVYALIGVFFSHFILNVHVLSSGGSYEPCCIAGDIPHNTGSSLEGGRPSDSLDSRSMDDHTPLIGETRKRNLSSPTVQMRVTGMTCESCVNTVKQALMGQHGVENASVSLSDGIATVSIVRGVHVDVGLSQRLTSAVERAGYQAVAL